MFRNLKNFAKLTAHDIAAVALHWAARAWYTEPDEFETQVSEELRVLADKHSAEAVALADKPDEPEGS